MSRTKKIGNAFEKMVNRSNVAYKKKGIALIDQIPNPVTITKNNGSNITGFLKRKSTVDYTGVIKGIGSIAFDAKTTNDNRFPLSMIADHQYQYLLNHAEMNGISFILADLRKHDKTFVIPIKELSRKWDIWKETDGKRGTASYSLDELEDRAIEVKNENGILVHYLKPFLK